jgi:hypothetical protein
MRRKELQVGMEVALVRTYGSPERVIVIDVEPWFDTKSFSTRVTYRRSRDGNGVAIARRVHIRRNARTGVPEVWVPDVVQLSQLRASIDDENAKRDAQRQRELRRQRAVDDAYRARRDRVEAINERLARAGFTDTVSTSDGVNPGLLEELLERAGL